MKFLTTKSVIFTFVIFLLTFSKVTFAQTGSGAFPNDSAFQTCERNVISNFQSQFTNPIYKLCGVIKDVYVNAAPYAPYGYTGVFYYICIPQVEFDPQTAGNPFSLCTVPLPPKTLPLFTANQKNTKTGNNDIPKLCGSVIDQAIA